MKKDQLVQLLYKACYQMYRLSLNNTPECWRTFNSMLEVKEGDLVFEVSSFHKDGDGTCRIGFLLPTGDNERGCYCIRSLDTGMVCRWENAKFVRVPPEMQHDPIFEMILQQEHGRTDTPTGFFYSDRDTAFEAREKMQERTAAGENYYPLARYLRPADRAAVLAKTKAVAG